jgi:hypothetical protein
MSKIILLNNCCNLCPRFTPAGGMWSQDHHHNNVLVCYYQNSLIEDFWIHNPRVGVLRNRYGFPLGCHLKILTK